MGKIKNINTKDQSETPMVTSKGKYQLLEVIGNKYKVKLPQLEIPITLDKYFFELLQRS